MKRAVSVLAALAFVMALSLGAAQAKEKKAGKKSVGTSAGKTNEESPLKAEMRLLNEAYKNLIEALVLDNLPSVKGPFEAVDRAREKTMAYAASGGLVLPKNGDKLNLFIELDKQFHKKIEGAVDLAGRGERKSLAVLAQKLMNACMDCHGKFRQ